MKYRILPETQPGIPQAQPTVPNAALRNVTRLGLTGLESIGGTPGELAELTNTITQQLPPPSEYGPNKLLGEALPQITEAISGILPTQKSLHEKSEKYIAPHLPEKYLEPQGYWEKVGDEFVSLIAPSLAFGGPKTLVGVGKQALSTATGLAGKEVAKKFGAGPLGQGIAQFGGALLPGILGNTAKVEELVNKNYKTAEKAGEGQYLNGEKLWNFNQDELKKITRGQPLPHKKEAAEQLNSLKTVFHGADRRIPVNQAVDRVQEFNKIAYDTRNYSKEARDIFKRVAEQIDDSIMDYGKQNKQFGKPYELAKTGYRGLKERSAIENYVKEFTPFADLNSKLGKTAFYILSGAGGVTAKGLTGAATSAAGTSAVLAAREADKLGRLLYRSKLARDIYTDSIKQAASHNKFGFLKDVKEFDKIAANYEKKKNNKPKYKIIDQM